MTNLHEAPDVSATLRETDLSIRRFRGASYEEALTAAQAELGDNIRVIGADRIRRGGLGGFFATDLGVEVAVAPVASDSRTTANSLARGSDDSPGDLTDQAVSDLDWDELMRRVEADDQRNNRRANRRIGVEQLLDDAERSDRSLSSWAREDEDDLGVPDFVKPLLLEPEQSDSADSVYGDSFFDIESEIEADVESEIGVLNVDDLDDEPDDELEIAGEIEALLDDEVDDDWFEGIDMAPDALADDDWFHQFIDQVDVSMPPSCESAPVERVSRRGPRIVDGGDGGARLLDDVLAVSHSPTEETWQSAPVVEAAPVVDTAPVPPPSVVLVGLVVAQPDRVFELIADYEPVGSPLCAPAQSAPALPAPALPLLPAPVASVRATARVATVVDDSTPDDAANIIEVVANANAMAMPEVTMVEATELLLSDPLRRPTELATIAVGRLAMHLAELPPFNGGLLPDAYRVNVAVTTPDGTRIEMSTEVDGTGD